MTAETFFQATNTLALLAWIALVLFPGRRVVSAALCGIVMPAILALGYAAIIGWKLMSDGPPPGDVMTLTGLRTIFGDDWVFAAAWTHYLVFDMVVGAWIARDSVRLGLPWPLRSAAFLLTFLAGPVGFLVHVVGRGLLHPQAALTANDPPSPHAASRLLLSFAIAMMVFTAQAAPLPEANYDEAAVGAYTLPDVLAGPDGRPATSADDWQTRCRLHQFALLEANVFGSRMPPAAVLEDGVPERADVTLADGMQAIRLQARLVLGGAAGAPVVDVLLYLPRSDRPVPVFLNLNFQGNQAEHPDPAIWITRAWLSDDEPNGIVGNRATEASRGKQARRWPVEAMLARGYGMGTACYGDIFPDRPDAAATGAINTWAWGLSRILDWLVRQPEIDATRVIVVGHSRNGKAALWAGACDERFAMVVSNESGCGGAALERRNYGETIAHITTRFPHWFCPKFATYAGRANQMPTDQHVLLAMTAPRPLYVASAIDDRWADPRGEFLATVAAEPVWRLFGFEGLGTHDWPPVDTPVGQRIGYHVRTGKHDLLAYDWQRFADFADRHLPPVEPPAKAVGDFRPAEQSLPVAPPPGAVVLFGDGHEPPRFTSMAGGPIDWRVEDGSLVVKTTSANANHIASTVMFADADIHAEFIIAPEEHGNSGLYLHGHYEMQIYDSFGVEPPTDQDEGALYRFAKPLVNAARRPGEWQVYDVRYIAPRRDASGRIVRAGSVTAWLNGKLVQNGVMFTEPRSPFTPYRHGATDFLRGIERQLRSTGRGPLFLQDHGSPTRYRNVWVKPLGDDDR